ncbi:MAG TPA: PAS domain S-box protein [Vicinamibacterales bacterium]
MPKDLGGNDNGPTRSVETWERLDAIVQFGSDAIVVVDARRQILMFNAAAERMFGWPRQDVIGSQLERLVSPRSRAVLDACFDTVRQTDHHSRGVSTSLAVAGVRIGGEEFPCEAFIAQFEVGGRREFAVSIRDITERKQFEDRLYRQVEFEKFLQDLSSTFIGLPDETVDRNMVEGLARVGEFLRLDRVTILELSPDRNEMVVAYTWSSPGVEAPPPRISIQSQPWWLGQVLRGDVTLAASLNDVPEQPAQYLRSRGVGSIASVPLRVGGEIAGAISFVTVRRYETWTPETVNRLRAIGDILWNALKRRQAMQALLATQTLVRESEERFRLAMSNVAAGVYTLDLEGLVTYVNPAAESMFGWTMAELLGKKMHDVAHYKHPDGSPFPASDCRVLQVLQKGIELHEQSDTFIRKDGRFFPVVHTASPLKRDGTIVGIVVGFRDDTERREAERAVRESEERFRLIANTAPVIIWMSDAGNHGTFANESWTNFTGQSNETALGEGWTDAIHPEDFERFREVYMNAFDRREPFRAEYRLRRQDGDFRWVFAQGVPRYDATGAFAGYIGSSVDVTERKEAEELLSTLSQRLIEAQEQERSHVARELHDDINQRLALLVLTLQTVKKPLRTLAPDLVEQLGEAIDSATRLTSDVQSLSHRLHSSRLHALGLEAAAREVCRELSERSGVTIDFQRDGVVAGLGEAVSVCVYRVLQEALQNAIKHSRTRDIAVSLRSDASALTLTVRDSGIGFDPSNSLKGRGLGLVSMKERLKLVDGQLTVDTHSPGGTTIRARVPLRRTDSGTGAV